jgi:hypothetical protein
LHQRARTTKHESGEKKGAFVARSDDETTDQSSLLPTFKKDPLAVFVNSSNCAQNETMRVFGREGKKRKTIIRIEQQKLQIVSRDALVVPLYITFGRASNS